MAGEETRRQKLESRNVEGGAADRLESQGTGREVDGPDRIGIFDRQSRVESKNLKRTWGGGSGGRYSGGGRGAAAGGDFQIVRIGLLAVGRVKSPRGKPGTRGTRESLLPKPAFAKRSNSGEWYDCD